MFTTLVEQIFRSSDRVVNARTRYSILAATMSELGELAVEIAISEGDSYKEVGSDGIIGEAIDAIACLVDLIRREKPSITEEELLEITRVKLQKWESKVKEHSMKINDVTCAVIIRAADSVLLVHSTGSPWNQWNFPKGIADDNEMHYDAAVRELQEETNISITSDTLIDRGLHPYIAGKDIHVFVHDAKSLIDAKQLVCASTFFCEKTQKMRPECDGFRMVPFSKLGIYLAPAIAKLYFSELQDFVENTNENNTYTACGESSKSES